MYRLLRRTSITVDEAVSMLLGQTDGPIEFEFPDGDEEAEANCPVFCLRDVLEGELDVLDGEYRMAQHENRPAHVIADKLAARQRQEAIMEQADVYRCAIADELNRGERSALRRDSTFSNSPDTYITLHSFNEWARGLGKDVVGEQASATVPAAPSPGNATKRPPRTKLLQQGDAILAELRRLGFDPEALPRNPSGKPSGKPGAKAAVHASLEKSPLFKGPTVFGRAWERLRKERRIVDRPDPPPHKK